MHLELQARLKLGVSSCLAGEPVRYDGKDKRDHWLVDRLGAFSELVSFCPEAVMGIPREPVSLVRNEAGALRVRGQDTGTDFTDRIEGHTSPWLDGTDLDALDGWVFKARSPSCAIQPIEVFEDGEPAGRAPGRFASAVLDRCSWLPAIDEDQLADPAQRRHFLERAFTRASWREFVAGLPSDGQSRDAAVSAWLSRHELQLLARERPTIAANAGCCDPAVLRSHAHLLFASLDATPTRAGQASALREAGNHLDVHEDEFAGLAILIGEYEQDRIDVEVPRQLLRGLSARGGDGWLRRQRFLDPFPLAWRDTGAASLPWPVRAARS